MRIVFFSIMCHLPLGHGKKLLLRFNKIPDSEGENCKAIIYNVISSLGVNTSQIRFHVVHKVGKKAEDSADQLLPGSFVEKTGTAFGLEEVRLKGLGHAILGNFV